MLDVVDELAWSAVHRHRIVHVHALPSRCASIVQTHLVVRIEVGGPNPSA
jgi:hypothetical protein